MAKSLPVELPSQADQVALQGRLNHDDVSWWLRIPLKVAGLVNRDREAGKEEMHGFDHMDEASIQPILELVASHHATSEPRSS